jgi:toxin HigB-1
MHPDGDLSKETYQDITFDIERITLYNLFMIRSFGDKETEKIFNGFQSRKLPYVIQRTAYRKLRMLNQARTLQDLAVFPGNRLEKLKGDRVDQHSIRINERWRICFRWIEGNAYQVEIVDYH